MRRLSWATRLIIFVLMGNIVKINKGIRRSLGTVFLLAGLSACVGFGDVFTRETEIYGPYYVADDPAASYKTLFYRYQEGLDLDRFENVSQVGYGAGRIFIKSRDQFYWFAVANDPGTDLGDLATKRMVSKPLTQAEFDRLLSKLGIKEFDFQFQE